MAIKRTQFFFLILVLLFSIACWFGALYLFMQLKPDIQWIAFCIFFGACVMAAIVGWQIENILKLFKKRHATKKKKRAIRTHNIFGRALRGRHVVEPPQVLPNHAFTPQKLGANYMQQKLQELKNLSVEGTVK